MCALYSKGVWASILKGANYDNFLPTTIIITKLLINYYFLLSVHLFYFILNCIISLNLSHYSYLTCTPWPVNIYVINQIQIHSNLKLEWIKNIIIDAKIILNNNLNPYKYIYKNVLLYITYWICLWLVGIWNEIKFYGT